MKLKFTKHINGNETTYRDEYRVFRITKKNGLYSVEINGEILSGGFYLLSKAKSYCNRVINENSSYIS